MIIFRYLAREVLLNMVAVSSVLLLIIMSGRFVKYLAQAASGELSPEVLLTIMGYRLPGFLELILPLGFFIAILLAYGRLHMDSEMTVLSACGLSQKRLLWFTLVPGLCVALFVGLLSTLISPLGVQKADLIIKQQSTRNEFDFISSAKFLETSNGGNVIYTREMSSDRKVMDWVFMAEMAQSKGSDDESNLSVIRARRGEQFIDPNTGERYLKLINGYRYEGRPGESDYQVTQFESYSQHIPRPKEVNRANLKTDGRTTQDLWSSDRLQDIAALHWRLSLPVLVLVVTFLAVPLSRTEPRQGRYVQMIPAILLYIVYLVSLNAARGAVEDGDLGVFPGIWGVHAVFFAVAVVLFFWPNIKQTLWLNQRKGKQERGNA